MKKIMFLMAVAGMFAFAACNNNTPAEEETMDTTPMEEMVDENATVADSAAVEAAVVEEAPVVAE